MPKTALRFPSLRAIGAIAVAIGVVGAATAAQAMGRTVDLIALRAAWSDQGAMQ